MEERVELMKEAPLDKCVQMLIKGSVNLLVEGGKSAQALGGPSGQGLGDDLVVALAKLSAKICDNCCYRWRRAYIEPRCATSPILASGINHRRSLRKCSIPD